MGEASFLQTPMPAAGDVPEDVAEAELDRPRASIVPISFRLNAAETGRIGS